MAGRLTLAGICLSLGHDLQLAALEVWNRLAECCYCMLPVIESNRQSGARGSFDRGYFAAGPTLIGKVVGMFPENWELHTLRVPADVHCPAVPI